MDLPYHHTFKVMMNDVVAAGRCCECAACVVVCPHNVIEIVDGKPKQTAKESAAFDYCGVSEGVGCDVCASACPRLWPRESHLRDAVFGEDRHYEGIFGVYRHIFVARTKQNDLLDKTQDGGIVTTLLSWARKVGEIDGAVVSAVGPNDAPCFPTPKLATTVEEIESSGTSWYTYCPNELALQEAEEKKLKSVAFVGVPCQITPLRKMSYMDPSFLVSEKKKPAIVVKQRDSLRKFADPVSLTIGLFCTEVFRPELMTDRIAKQMEIPLESVTKFNVKGEVLIYQRNGNVATIPLEEAMAEYQRPACLHCADFSAEMADISCGGIGTDRATLVVLRTQKAVDIWKKFEAAGMVEVWPIQEHKKAWNILQRLARKQRERVPEGPTECGVDAEMPQYSAFEEMGVALGSLTAKSAEETEACTNAAYNGRPRPVEGVRYIGGQPIPGDPGEPAPGEKRKLPPPPTPQQGGASPFAPT